MLSALTRPGELRGANRSGLSGAVLAAAGVLVLLSWRGAVDAARAHPLELAAFVALCAALMLLDLDLGEEGTLSVAGVGLLATGFSWGVGAAVDAALCAVAVQAVLGRGERPTAARAGVLALASAAGAEVYGRLAHAGSPLVPLGPALAAGVAFAAVAVGLLTALGASAERPALRVLDRQFRWLALSYVGFGPLALACTSAAQRFGIVGVVAFAIPPALLLVAAGRSLESARAALDGREQALAELDRQGGEQRDLLAFAAGLAAHARDSRSLVEHTERSLERLLGGRVELTLGSCGREATPLRADGRTVGGLTVEGGDREHWQRLAPALTRQLGAAVAAALDVEETTRSQLATIAALSHSLEASSSRGGGHTSRVADIAVAVARRLGYQGRELDALYLGALLHDIGEIAIPGAIVHKAGPLDDDEWRVMKRHPLVSELLLAGAELPAIVLEIARSTHERIDGHGYPDGLAGEAIPLPARIVLVADAFDALTTHRPYRRARRARAALDEIAAHGGEQFCQRVVAALERVYAEEPALLGEPARLTIVA